MHVSHLWHRLSLVVARPPLWCDPLRLFLGMAEAHPPPSTEAARTFRHSDAIPPLEAGSSATSTAAAGSGGDGVEPPSASTWAVSATYSAELRWIVSRAQQPGCGMVTDGTGFFKGSALVKWLLVQALAASREQAVPLCEAMRRQGLIHPVGEPTPFVDGAAQYRFVPQATMT